jgi:hypothetical protein
MASKSPCFTVVVRRHRRNIVVGKEIPCGLLRWRGERLGVTGLASQIRLGRI